MFAEVPDFGSLAAMYRGKLEDLRAILHHLALLDMSPDFHQNWAEYHLKRLTQGMEEEAAASLREEVEGLLVKLRA